MYEGHIDGKAYDMRYHLFERSTDADKGCIVTYTLYQDTFEVPKPEDEPKEAGMLITVTLPRKHGLSMSSNDRIETADDVI